MPTPCGSALDAGCGDGTLLAKLAARATRAVGIDASPAMVARAQRNAPQAQLVQGDLLTHDFRERFDFVACVAVVHHLDLVRALERLRALTAPRGVLAILGLARSAAARDVAYDAGGAVATRVLRLRRNVYDPGAPLAAARTTYREVERTAASVLPGSSFRRLLLFRYLLTWRAPA